MNEKLILDELKDCPEIISCFGEKIADFGLAKRVGRENSPSLVIRGFQQWRRRSISSCRYHLRLGRTVMSHTSRGRDIGKPDDAYTRKQKNLLAYNNFWDMNRNSTLRSNNGGISKRPANSRSGLTQAENMSHSESNNSVIYISKSSSPGCCPVIATTHLSSIKDIGKPDDAYTRKQKNLLAYNNFWDMNRNSTLRSNNGGISKRPANSRSGLTQAENMSHSESNNSVIYISKSSSPGCCPVIATTQ
ncbi:unnamed protein product [Fraxinus pennsylvanica]|uniref:Uncharacterized protein n=1 Tax=Fraxinus pennsylvanica TaxID=56036 RepID=A0AAD1ZAI0_9LAMI|nr:unnamed protein product [Fraxinus pennsylvanica]